MYFTYCFDEKTGDSSVVKIETTTLKCLEVYQSNFKIVHMSFYEIDFTVEPKNKEKVIKVKAN